MNLTLKKLGKLLGSEYRKKFFLLVIIQAFLSLFDLLFLAAISLSIYSFSNSKSLFVSLPLTSHQINLNINTIAILLFSSALIRSIGSLIIQRASNQHFAAREAEVSTILAKQFLNQKWDQKTKTHSSNFLQIYRVSITFVFNQIFRQAIQQVGELFTFCAIVIGLLILRPQIALIVICYFLVIAVLILNLTIPKLQRYGIYNSELTTENLRTILEAQNISREIRISQGEVPILQNLYHQRLRLGKIEKERSFLQSVPRQMFESSLVIGLSLALFTTNLTEGKYEILQTVALITAASFRLLPSINSIIIGYGNFRNALPYLNNVMEITEELQVNLELPPLAFLGENQITRRFNGNLVFEDVTFGYSGGKKPIIKNFSFNLKANKTLCITGDSGVGKSTLLMLILGLIDPQSGEIYEEVNGKKFTIGTNSSGISYLSQEFALLDDTIAYNIALRVTSDSDRQSLRGAAQSAGILQLIDSFEKGFETSIGENGNQLSRGEKQRLGLARALFNNPQLLILDEPTSNLDLDNEKVIWESLEALHGRISIIIVSHRKVPENIIDMSIGMGSK